MLWIGLGATQDRALAYAWMELAAERGYRSFSEKRDRYREAMTPEERARADRESPALRAEYADAAAEPRQAAAMRRERQSLSGSRLGSTATPVRIVVPGVGTLDSTEYYQAKYWEPALYREWQDSIWQEVRIGRVSVGDIEAVGKEAGSSGPAPQPEPQDTPEPPATP